MGAAFSCHFVSEVVNILQDVIYCVLLEGSDFNCLQDSKPSLFLRSGRHGYDKAQRMHIKSPWRLLLIVAPAA